HPPWRNRSTTVVAHERQTMTDARATAEALYRARETRVPVPPLTEADPSLTAEGAYEIQGHFVELLKGEEGRIVGYKLGLTSKSMQEMLGIGEPDYGPVVSSMAFDDGVTVDLDRYIQPKVEGEIALMIDKPVQGPGVTAAQVADSLSGAVAAIEMVDSRIADWKIKLPDTIADLASSAAAVLSSRVVPVDFDLRLCGMVITKNGETMGTGAGAAALGDPVAAVAWLANTLAPFGVVLEPGHFIMTGALHAAFEVEPGDHVQADFDHLGSVSMSFVGGE
ncbi:MAG: fumarylacetoacetate hydrolase family protein, partial [Actinomycetota bacterium]|nr:fumarylacetoacetate hydrolase family protein [Actinomycetota bacterium]